MSDLFCLCDTDEHLHSNIVVANSQRDQGQEEEEADCGQPEGAGQQDHPRSAQRLLGHRHHAGPGTSHQEADDVEGDWRSGEAFLPPRTAPLEQQTAQGEGAGMVQACWE